MLKVSILPTAKKKKKGFKGSGCIPEMAELPQTSLQFPFVCQLLCSLLLQCRVEISEQLFHHYYCRLIFLDPGCIFK